MKDGQSAINFWLALDVRHRQAHEAADAFWNYWRENGETHKHGYYESTWGAINRAIRMAGTIVHHYGQTPTPKQEAVTAAVVASPEKLADAIDKLAHFVGWATLAHMKVKFRNDLLAPAQEAMVTLRELQFASTIPRVADHLEDGGKAEAEYDSWIADLRSTLPPALPACTVCGGTGTVVLHDGDAYVCECGGSGVQMNDNPRPDPTALKGWKLHRCPDDKQCRAAIGGGCASGWCEHFGVQAEHIYPNIIPAGPQRTAIGMRREGS